MRGETLSNARRLFGSFPSSFLPSSPPPYRLRSNSTLAPTESHHRQVSSVTMSINMQAFRSRSTGDIVDIPALVDPKTGNHIILWRDIQSVFENAKTVWNGKSLIPLLTDENLEQ